MNRSSDAVKEMMREMAQQARVEQVRRSQADSNMRNSVRPLFGEPRKCSPSSKTEEVEKVLGQYKEIKPIIQNTRGMQYLIGVDNLPLAPLPDSAITTEVPSKKPSVNNSKEQNGEVKLENSTEKKSSNENRKSHSSDGSQSTECSKSNSSHDSNNSSHQTSLDSSEQSKNKTVAVDKKLSKDSGHQKSLGTKRHSSKPSHSHNNHHHSSLSLSTKSSPSHSNKHAHSPSPHIKIEKMSPSKPSSKNLKNHLSSASHPDGAKVTVPPNGIKKEVGNVFSNVLKPKPTLLFPSKEHNMSDDVGAIFKEMSVKEPLTAIHTPGHKQDRFPFSTSLNENAKRNGKKIEEFKKEQIISEESLSKQLSISDDSDKEQTVTKLPADRRGTAPVKEPKQRRMSSSSDSSSSGSESSSDSDSPSSDEEEEKEKEKAKSPEADQLSSPTREGEKKMPWSLVNFIPKGTPTGLALNVENPGFASASSKKVDKENKNWLDGWNILGDEEFFARDQPVSDDGTNINVDKSSAQSILEPDVSEEISMSEILSPIADKVFPSHSSPDIGAKSPSQLDKMQKCEKSELQASSHSTASKHHSSNSTPSKQCTNSTSSKNSNSAERHRSRTSTPTGETNKKEKSSTPKSEKKRRRTSGNVPQKDLVWEKLVKENQYHSDSDSDFVDVETVTPEKQETGAKSKEIAKVSKVLNLDESCVEKNENSNKRTTEGCDEKKSDTNTKYRSKHTISKMTETYKNVICDRKEIKNGKPPYLDSDMEHIFSSVIGENNPLLSPLPNAPVKLQPRKVDISFFEGKPSIIVHLNLSFLNHIPLKGKLFDSLKTKNDCLESKLTSKLDEEKNNKIEISTSEDLSVEPVLSHKKENSENRLCSPERIKSAKRKLEVEKTEEQKRRKSAKSSHKKSESPERTAKTDDRSPLKKATPDPSEQTANTKHGFRHISDDHEKDISSTKENIDSPPEKPPKIKERRSSISSNSSQHSHKSKRTKHRKEETSNPDQHLLVPEKTHLQNKLPQVFQNGHVPSLSHKTESFPITCLSSRIPAHDEKSDSADRYLTQAKQLKHKADTLKDKLAKLLTYIEAVLSFLQCGSAMEQEHISEANKIFTMYKDTFRLITHICRFRGSHEADLTEKERKLSVLSLRIQSLLCLKLFNLKKQETLKLKRIIDEHNKGTAKPSAPGHAPSPCRTGWSNRTTGTPSPMSPTPSPVESVGSVGSQGSCNDLTPSKLPNGNLGTGTTVAVPQRIHSISQHYLKTVNFLVQCHDYWDQADAAMQDYEEFFKCLDVSAGQLSLHSSIPELVRYICLGLQNLKDT